MKFYSILAAAALLTPAAASAQTVTVNKTATPNATTFNTISAALAAVEADAAEPNVVQVTDSERYEEVINILAPVTLEATAGSRATIELLPNTNGTPMPGETQGNGGIWINLPDSLTTASVKISNFNILPALDSTTSATRLRTAIENGNNNLYLEVNNCIITPNENGAPLVTDPVSSRIFAVFPGSNGSIEPYNPDIVQFGGHGIVLGRTYTGFTEGDGVELLLKDSVISHFKNDYYPAATEPERFPTGIVMHSPYGEDPNAYDTSLTRITRVEGGGVSFARVLISAAGDLDVRGTENEPVHLRGSASWSLRFDGPAFNYRNFSHAIITDMSSIGIYDRGFGPIRWTMDNSIMFMALNHVFLVQPGRDSNSNIIHPAVGQIVIEDSTLVGGRFHATAGRAAHTYRLEPGTETDLHFQNSIIGGKKDQPDVPVNVISVAGNNTVTAEGSAFITAGPYALRPSNPFSRGADAELPVNVTEQYGEDPMFLVTDVNGGPNWPANPDFLDVQNPAYATRNSEGGPLGGGADYVGPLANVDAWELY